MGINLLYVYNMYLTRI